MCCEDTRSRWQEYLDGLLPPGEAQEVAAHLETCAACRRGFELLRQVDLALATQPVLEEPMHFTAQVMAGVRAMETRPVFRLHWEDVMVSLASAWTMVIVLFALSLFGFQDALGIQVILEQVWWTWLPAFDPLWHAVLPEPLYAVWALASLCVAVATAVSAIALSWRWPGRSLLRSW